MLPRYLYFSKEMLPNFSIFMNDCWLCSVSNIPGVCGFWGVTEHGPFFLSIFFYRLSKVGFWSLILYIIII